MPPRRVQARIKGVAGYVNAMRPTWLGNPWRNFKTGYSLEYSLLNYEGHLRKKLKNKKFAKRFDQLWDRDIGCTCSDDKRCHVDIIIKLLYERKGIEQP